MKSLNQQIVVIVGASSGMGLLAAKEAAGRGARVVLAARNRENLETAAEEIRRDGGEAIAIPTDVADHAQVESLARKAVAAFGRIDTWVTTAAVSAYGTFREQTLDDFRQIMEVNFMGQVHCAKAALPHLEKTAGALICVGSALSDRGVPLQGAYCASKHALKGWLDSLRVELRKAGSQVRVTLIKPSSIDTPLFNKARTLMGVMPQPIPPVYEPELAARAILRATERNDRDVYVGGAGKLLSVAERISPRLVDLQQHYQGFEGQKTDWKKSPEAPSNLYGPVADDGGVRGDFSGDAKKRSLYQYVAERKGLAISCGVIVGLGLLAVRRDRDREEIASRIPPRRYEG